MTSTRTLTTVAVAGASGYSGGELLRLILGHPDLAVGTLSAGSNAGQPVRTVHPHLVGLADRVFAGTEPAELAQADVVVLALPHGQSGPLAAHLPPDLPVIDLGADFRLHDPQQWADYYGGDHAGTWTYGLPELPGARDAIAGARRIANPGCYPTGISLGLAPLLAAGLVEPRDLVIVAASGTSGAGRKPSDSLLATQVMGAMSAYKAGGVHQHTPEIEQNLAAAAGEKVTVSFTPTLAPMPRGILAVSTARAADGADAESVREALHAAYDHETFVHVLPEGVWPSTASTLGSNAVHLQVAHDRHSGRVSVISALDNLVKGAAGQAIQNLNLVLGLPEGTGLTSEGVAP
jgi:N-acetyl-gamma-glutamyl-phosphate reductase